MKKEIVIPILIVGALTVVVSLFVVRPFGGSDKSGVSGPQIAKGGTSSEAVESKGGAINLTGMAQGAAPANAETPDEAVLTEEEVWKERLLSLLRNDTLSDRELGRQLLSMVKDEQAPDWVRAHAMTNALNFLDDEHYGEDVKPLAFRADLPEVVYDAILDDLINRDPAIILPVAREFAAVAQHPLAGAIEEFVKSVDNANER